MRSKQFLTRAWYGSFWAIVACLIALGIFGEWAMLASMLAGVLLASFMAGVKMQLNDKEVK